MGQGGVGKGGNVAGQRREDVMREEDEECLQAQVSPFPLFFFSPISESHATHKKSDPPTLSLPLILEVCLPPSGCHSVDPPPQHP